MGGAKRNPSPSRLQGLMGIAALHPSYGLLCGGDKSTQAKDIKTAKHLAKAWSE